MVIFRWIMGVIGGLFAVGWLFTFLMYVLRDDDRFAELGKRLRHFTILIALFWFNFEIWGRVVWTLRCPRSRRARRPMLKPSMWYSLLPMKTKGERQSCSRSSSWSLSLRKGERRITDSVAHAIAEYLRRPSRRWCRVPSPRAPRSTR